MDKSISGKSESMKLKQLKDMFLSGMTYSLSGVGDPSKRGDKAYGIYFAPSANTILNEYGDWTVNHIKPVAVFTRSNGGGVITPRLDIDLRPPNENRTIYLTDKEANMAAGALEDELYYIFNGSDPEECAGLVEVFLMLLRKVDGDETADHYEDWWKRVLATQGEADEEDG